MYNVHIHAGPAELGVLFVGDSASASSSFDRNKSKPCSFRRPCITKCTPIFLDLPSALLLMRAAGNNGWLCGVLQ